MCVVYAFVPLAHREMEISCLCRMFALENAEQFPRLVDFSLHPPTPLWKQSVVMAVECHEKKSGCQTPSLLCPYESFCEAIE